ncbi:MAG: hypothetical protein MUO33_08435 [Sedimentisphaerales bacterium]|nr:hypothetical protein [Sedimentisphaerales bacterium]
MKVERGSGSYGLPWRKPCWALRITALFLLVVTSPSMSTAQEKKEIANPAFAAASAESNVLVWDTLSPFVDAVDIRDRNSWRPVPTDLLMLEADPSAASSDPGYYGREYSFTGDAVVENERLTAVFWSRKGKVVIYSRDPAERQPRADSGQKRVEFIPLQLKRGPASITCCKILQNTGDETALEVSFSAERIGENVSAIFSFSPDLIGVEIKPAENMKGISLSAPI